MLVSGQTISSIFSGGSCAHVLLHEIEVGLRVSSDEIMGVAGYPLFIRERTLSCVTIFGGRFPKGHFILR